MEPRGLGQEKAREARWERGLGQAKVPLHSVPGRAQVMGLETQWQQGLEQGQVTAHASRLVQIQALVMAYAQSVQGRAQALVMARAQSVQERAQALVMAHAQSVQGRALGLVMAHGQSVQGRAQGQGTALSTQWGQWLVEQVREHVVAGQGRRLRAQTPLLAVAEGTSSGLALLA